MVQIRASPKTRTELLVSQPRCVSDLGFGNLRKALQKKNASNCQGTSEAPSRSSLRARDELAANVQGMDHLINTNAVVLAIMDALGFAGTGDKCYHLGQHGFSGEPRALVTRSLDLASMDTGNTKALILANADAGGTLACNTNVIWASMDASGIECVDNLNMH